MHCDPPPRLVHIFQGVGYNIIDDPPKLLRIHNDPAIFLHKIFITEVHIFGVQFHRKILRAVLKIISGGYSCKIIRNPVCINFRIQCQLINEKIHLVSFIINRLDVSVHLFRRVRDTVHDPFHISLDRGDGRLQIMRNITDKFLILPVKLHLLLRICLQPQAHLLKILAQLADLIIRLLLDLKIEIPLLNISGRFLKLFQRDRNRTVNPVDQQAGSNKNNRQVKLLDLIRPARHKRMHRNRRKNHRQDHYRHKNNHKFCPKLHTKILSVSQLVQKGSGPF